MAPSPLCAAMPSQRILIAWAVAPNLITILVNRSDAENLAGRLALIESSLLKRPVKFYGALGSTRTLIHTTAAVPAFIGMQGNRGLALYRIWYVYVYLAYVDTCIAAIADFSISNDRSVRRSHVGYDVYLLPLVFRSLEDFTGALKSNCGASCRPRLQEIPAFYCCALLSFFHAHISTNAQSLGAFEPNKLQNSKPLSFKKIQPSLQKLSNFSILPGSGGRIFQWIRVKMERMPPDGSKLCLSELNRSHQPAGCEQSKRQRSLYKLQSPIAKLSDLFVCCQEFCHIYVTIIVIESWFSGAATISERINAVLSIEMAGYRRVICITKSSSERHPQRLRECGASGSADQP
jgi:hypothetical protein